MSEHDKKPNILLIMVDQMSFPPMGYGSDHGFVDPLKQIFGFLGDSTDPNDFQKFFPGLWALRENSVVLNNHRAASSACVPSRAVIFSGQYGPITGVTQTDGLFKSGANPMFSWLDGKSFPTIGDWMRECEYKSHYFGKWHVSGEATTDLEEYGFSDWELSNPDPHGALPTNLGYYRDYQFEDLTTSFLRRQGLGIPYSVAHAAHNVAQAAKKKDDADLPEVKDTAQPWFAVSSFTNPHDIASYPVLPRLVNSETVEGASFTLGVPPQGAKGKIPKTGTMAIDLNRHGFPQNNANVAATWNEPLHNKPSCQLEYAYKMGLTMASKLGWIAAMQNPNLTTKQEQLDAAVSVALASNVLGLPFALTSNPELACRAFMQYYGYVIHEVDQHIDSVLKELEASGQADNTIVIFTADHGEYGGSHHMMMEKWHTAYEENTHVPMVIRFPKARHEVPGGLRQISDPTNHADILPTILGLAGITNDQRVEIQQKLRLSHDKTLTPVGADLSGLILGKEHAVRDPLTGQEREGVLFVTYDTISAPLESDKEAISGPEDPLTGYDVYLVAVENTIRKAVSDEVAALQPGSVAQPCLVHSVVNKDHWKLVRYFGPDDVMDWGERDQFELYDLDTDPNEECNLLVFDAAGEQFPTVAQPVPVGQAAEAKEIEQIAMKMKDLLSRLEAEMLKEP